MARWSKLKAKIEERICAPLRGRIEFRSTRYRGSAEPSFHGGGRGFITVDGAEVFNMATEVHLMRLFELQDQAGVLSSRARWEQALAQMGQEDG